MSLKICSICSNEKNITEFLKNRAQCSQCRSILRKERELKNKIKIDINLEKKCSNCFKTFNIDKYKLGNNKCLDCLNQRRRELRNKDKPIIQEGYKLCKKCDKTLIETDFRHNRRICKECEKNYGREYRQTPIGKEKSKQWVQNNKERMQELQAQWFQKNKHAINEKLNEKAKNDIKYKLRKLCASRIRSCFDKNNNSVIEYLNCSIIELSDWLRFNYDDKMNDENQGSYWHIDHVIPIHHFNLDNENEVRLCFSWFNLSPLEANKNITKNKNIDKEQIIRHISNLKKFTENNIDLEFEQLCAKHLDAGNSLEPLTTTLSM